MSLGYDPQKWTIMTMLAILTVCLVGMINLAFGGSQDEEDEDNKDKDEIPFDCIPHETEYLTRGNEITIKKSYILKFPALPDGTVLQYKHPVPCPNWKAEVQNYTTKGYTITFEGESQITMQAPTTPTTQEEMDKSQDEHKSKDTFLDNEDTGNNSAIEEYVKKYCPEYADPDGRQLLVLCDYPEIDEPEGTTPQPPQD